MNRSELYEDGFMDKDKQIKILYEKGVSISEIQDRLGVSEVKIVEVINKSKNKSNLNERKSL